MFLFDLDGTLIRKTSIVSSLKQRVFSETLEQVFGLGGIDYMQFPIHGETDRSILRMVLSGHGFSRRSIEVKEGYFWESFRSEFESRTRDRTGQSPEYGALPGSRRFLEKITGITKGIATGNIECVARYKLYQAGIEDYFSFGGFGEDGILRADIVRKAISRSPEPPGGRCVLFGDTPSDIRAGIDAGCIVCAISGTTFPRESLEMHCRPCDAVFEGYDDTESILEFCMFPHNRFP